MTPNRKPIPLPESPANSSKLYEFVKRLLDIALAVVCSSLLGPVLAAVAMAVRMDSPGPILYRQRRIGKNGKEFWLYRFRTMYVNPDPFKFQVEMEKAMDNLVRGQSTFPLFANDIRITKVGRFLRKTSLDELPQFLNIFSGDMSFVGPRPALPYEWDLYGNEHKKRLSITPGVTGIWQTSSDTNLSFSQMVQMDLEYVEKRSILLDMKILLQTIVVILHGRRRR